MKRITSILLCLVLLMTPIRAGEPEFRTAAGYAVGALVVCVGGYCLYKIVKVCQKKFPKKKAGETETNSLWLSLEGEDEYAAAYEYTSPGSCPPLPDLNAQHHTDDSSATTFVINVRMSNGVPSITMSASEDSQTWDEFAAEMATHGLFLTGHASYEPQFSRNRVPCDGSSIPISFEPFTGKITHSTGGEMKRVTIERSLDLSQWFPLLTTTTGENSSFGVIDTTVSGQCFYRVQVTQP